MNNFFIWFDDRKDIGVLLLRLFVGVRLIYGVIDNVTSWEHMIKFRGFLQQFNFPIPLVAAIVSVYAQLLAGVMFILGWKIRFAAILMIINFLIAILMVHWGEKLEPMTPALAILFISILFFFQGAGKYSLDNRIAIK
jgi:putative oxidoreductase